MKCKGSKNCNMFFSAGRKIEIFEEENNDLQRFVEDLCILPDSTLVIGTPYIIVLHKPNGEILQYPTDGRLQKLLSSSRTNQLLAFIGDHWKVYEFNGPVWGIAVNLPVDFTVKLLAVASDGAFYALDDKTVYIIEGERVKTFLIKEYGWPDMVIAVKDMILLRFRYKLEAYNRNGERLWSMEKINVVDVTVAENEVGIYVVDAKAITFVTNEVTLHEVFKLSYYVKYY